ncbi:dTDP-4-dehydrorhamnose reductase [Alloacidobacterium sp.]|uniref:dTDP-4-dehydrorhamnose reductase n=1 Tax=Alloacidobacterium sp. TaxID=2951999 RepID=UPI002D2E25CE|nr:dTDP-4-dehydrorhamnose reductase [Alloacidobacterium sp.]HYK35570.1 dTDP-4-dehydrorhamnose reductase [Alloacidobacterium sp.]
MSPRPVILIFGASGQVGVELQRSFTNAGEVSALVRKSADFSRPEDLRSIISTVKPSIILNAAAYTAVDRAESEPELAMTINCDAPRVLGEEAVKLDALLVHYSTDYVFDGSKKSSWIEEDGTNPLNTYGRTKLAGERAVQDVGGKYLIFRTSWVYGPHGHNFLLTMLRLGHEHEQLKIVDDQFGAPTSSHAIADATRAIVDKALANGFESGVYHMTCGGETTWCRFAHEIFAEHHWQKETKVPQVIPISSNEYSTPAIRPANSVLCNEKLKSTFGVALPNWESALGKVMSTMMPRGPKGP